MGDGVSLPIAGPDDTNTTTRNITEANMESTELGTNYEEETKRFDRIFDFGKEVWCKAEGERNLCRLIEIGLENRPKNNFNLAERIER